MIDDALDRLVAAYEQAGLPALEPPPADIEDTLQRVAAAVLPLRLPSQLLAFWRRLDPHRLSATPYPTREDARGSLDSWTMQQEFSHIPQILFPIGYESHGYDYIELEDGLGHGGSIFAAHDLGEPYQLMFADLAAYLDQLATTIELESMGGSQPHTWFGPDTQTEWEQVADVRLAPRLPLPGHGYERSISADARGWPPHWHAANGLADVDRHVRGATATVAELLAKAARGHDATGTVQITVTQLAMTAAGCQVTVHDGSASLVVWCPAGLSPYGPINRRRFELDLLVHANPARPPDVGPLQREATRLALGADFAGAAEVIRQMNEQTFESPRAATATGLRPLD